MEIQRSLVVIAGKHIPYASGTTVTGAKGVVFLSGAVGEDPDTGIVPEELGEQARLALEAIKQRLEEYGSSLKYILHVWVYMVGQFPNAIRNDPHWQEYVNAAEAFWKENDPECLRANNPLANTLLGVTSLALPEYKLEIQVVAAIP